MDKKAIKFLAIGFVAALLLFKFENGLLWNTLMNILSQMWGMIYPKISDLIAFFLIMSPYALGVADKSDFARWLVNMGTIATVCAFFMYLKNSKNSKLFILWKIFYLGFFTYATWFANGIACYFWLKICDGKQSFALVTIALFNILLWLVAYYVFFKSLMAKEKIL
ncbi:MAG: hypothetical protein MJ097_01620 [Dorea sp.]|nr:hypothetical protein [Dorea sp.]